MNKFDTIINIWVTLLSNSIFKTVAVLKEIYGDLYRAWDCANNDLTDECKGYSFYDNFKKKELIKKANDIYYDCLEKDIKIVMYQDEIFPLNLKNSGNCPYLLYYKGKLPAELGISEELFLGVVGSRRCTPYGRINAFQFSKSLSELGITIVSGMARGIDGEAHKGALSVNAYNIAVLGCGVDYIYPKEHKTIYDKITKIGCVISEHPPGTPPFKSYFPARNRIISGLSMGLLVVEASENSGAMITVNYTLNEGKEIFAIPGNITSESSLGCNLLIKQGAVCTTGYGDILDAYRMFCKDKSKISEWIDSLSGAEAAVANAIINGCFMANDICKVTGRNMGSVLSALTMLEIKGILSKGLDGSYKIIK